MANILSFFQKSLRFLSILFKKFNLLKFWKISTRYSNFLLAIKNLNLKYFTFLKKYVQRFFLNFDLSQLWLWPYLISFSLNENSPKNVNTARLLDLAAVGCCGCGRKTKILIFHLSVKKMTPTQLKSIPRDLRGLRACLVCSIVKVGNI